MCIGFGKWDAFEVLWQWGGCFEVLCIIPDFKSPRGIKSRLWPGRQSGSQWLLTDYPTPYFGSYEKWNYSPILVFFLNSKQLIRFFVSNYPPSDVRIP